VIAGTLFALGAAILLSAFFTAAELAIFAPAEFRVRTLANEGVRGAQALAGLRARPERVLVLLRLGDACSDVAAGALVAYAAFPRLETVWLAVAIGAVALLILYLGELLPIGLAANHGLRFALLLAPALVVLTRVFGAPLNALSTLARVKRQTRPAGTSAMLEPEIRQLAALGHMEVPISEHERDLIERAARLEGVQVWDIMTPRVDIFAWKDSLLLRDIVPQLGTVRFSRVPVYRESIDDITGVLHIRDAYQALVSGQRDVPLKALVREPLIVPGSVPVTKLLRDFQARRIHLAVVVDEYGGTDGLVTLEDVLEELVGEIVDETDVAEDSITRTGRNEIVAAGDADLREINHFFNTSFPQLEHRTFNGYLLEELGRVPERGEIFDREGIHIEIVEATETQVTRARLRRTATPSDAVAVSGQAGAVPERSRARQETPAAAPAADRPRPKDSSLPR
jgi:magnesium and cobalt exporter, CNNM family